MFGLTKKRDQLSLEWLSSFNEFYPHTPDIATLEQYETQWLFVIDDTQTGHPRNDFMFGSRYLCNAFTKYRFTVWKKRLGQESFPIPFEEKGANAPHLRIKGQLFVVNPKKIIIPLDNYRGNTVQFTRKRVRVQIPYQRFEYNDRGTFDLFDECIEIRAWMYVGILDYWKDMSWPPLKDIQVSTIFEPVQSFKPRKEWMSDYYFFTKQEYGK